MNWFYFASGCGLILMGLLVLTFPQTFKTVLTYIVRKDLFIIPGVLEIALGLGTLYFRETTKMKWFVYITGLLLFVDGIFYLLSSQRFKEVMQLILESDEKTWRSYGILSLLIAFGYFLAAVR